METNGRLRAGVRWVDVGRWHLAVHLETGPCLITAAPAPFHEKGGLIDDIIISPDIRSFMASIYSSRTIPCCSHLFGACPRMEVKDGISN